MKNTKMGFLFLTPLVLLSIMTLFASTGSVFAANDDKVVILHTNSGPLVIEFFPDHAPNTVENFLTLTENGFYDNTIFHRIIKDFMIQGGDPLTKYGDDGFTNITRWGTGDSGTTILAEFNTIKHDRGIVSMARGANFDSASSQFFIVHDTAMHLDGQYSVFGRLLTAESYATLDKIAILETTSRDVPTVFSSAQIIKTEIVTKGDIDDKLDLGSPVLVDSEFIAVTDSGRYINEQFDFSIIPPDGWKTFYPEPGADADDPIVTFLGPAKPLGETDVASPFIYINANKLVTHTFQEHLDSRVSKYHNMNKTGSIEIESEKYVEFKNTKDQTYSAYILFAKQSGAIGGAIPFAQAIISHTEYVYGITYANHLKYFDDEIDVFYDTVETFERLSEETESSISEILEETSIESTGSLDTVEELEEARIKAMLEESEGLESGGGCLIATAAFGSEMAPQIQLLREIRDNTVLQTESGHVFMNGFNQFYYSFSPVIADYERENPAFKEAVKLTLTPLLTSLTLLQYADINSESEMLGYGIGIIMLNIGMYFAAPAVLIMKVRNFHKLQ